MEGNPVFIYLDAFCSPEHFERYLPEYANLDELKAHYKRGGLGDVKVKKFLNKVIQAELAPIGERRKLWESRLPRGFNEIASCRKCKSAGELAAKTLADVRHSMKNR